MHERFKQWVPRSACWSILLWNNAIKSIEDEEKLLGKRRLGWRLWNLRVRLTQITIRLNQWANAVVCKSLKWDVEMKFLASTATHQPSPFSNYLSETILLRKVHSKSLQMLQPIPMNRSTFFREGYLRQRRPKWEANTDLFRPAKRMFCTYAKCSLFSKSNNQIKKLQASFSNTVFSNSGEKLHASIKVAWESVNFVPFQSFKNCQADSLINQTSKDPWTAKHNETESEHFASVRVKD